MLKCMTPFLIHEVIISYKFVGNCARNVGSPSVASGHLFHYVTCPQCSVSVALVVPNPHLALGCKERKKLFTIIYFLFSTVFWVF